MMGKIQNKTWFRLTLNCDARIYDAVSNFLFEQGADGVEEQEKALIGYFNHTDPLTLEKAMAAYLNNLQELGFSPGDFTLEEKPAEDWAAGWRSYFRSIRVTPELVVKPPWEKWQGPEKIVLSIMPRMAFGTGSHETTQLCLIFAAKVLRPGLSVLDIGAGSGILSIFAAKSGGRPVVAVETDEDALENITENAGLNDVLNCIEIIHGSIDRVSGKTFDLIMANINRPVLIELLPGIRNLCHVGTQLILSGLLISEQGPIIESLNVLGLSVSKLQDRGEWTALMAEIQSP